jgi:hypothetical protein
MPDLFNPLSEQSLQQLEAAVTTTAAATYQNEVQNFIQPQTGFHFTGNKTNLSQLKTFSIAQMGVKIREVAPNLWALFGILLDADPNRRRTAPSDKTMDEGVEMELADIATAVNGNDEGSEEEELGDEGTWTSPRSLLHFPLYLLVTLWHRMLDWPRLNWHFRVCSGQIFKKKINFRRDFRLQFRSENQTTPSRHIKFWQSL